ncbi:MAG: TIGR04282 family arsenosugar biosynthesis glycosyltransferase [Thermoanaerobaculia bacterium]
MAERPVLLLFARSPVAGRVKTRLVQAGAGALSPQQASDLYRAFLEDASRLYGRGTDWDSVLCADPGPADAGLSILFPHPWRARAQGDGDLGARLRRAFADAFASGAPAAAAVGSDHPTLPVRRLRDVFDALAADDAAVVPAEDGGYCALGLAARTAGALDEIFREVPWSMPDVLETTLDRMHRAGVSCRKLDPFYDVDRPEDLERLKKDLRARDPREPDFPSATAEWLGLRPDVHKRGAL